MPSGDPGFNSNSAVPIVDAVERFSNPRKVRALDESRRFVIASRGIDGVNACPLPNYIVIYILYAKFQIIKDDPDNNYALSNINYNKSDRKIEKENKSLIFLNN